MLQNKLLFNQSAVSLEIIGLPDFSNNENSDEISIISSWKLKIIEKPPIEGNFDHLSSIMEAFYIYSDSLINNQIGVYESNLIDIKAENYYTHNVLLKSSKPDVKPLNLKIGNSILSDIINCFDQLNSSSKVKKVNTNVLSNIPKKGFLNLINKENISSIIFPPLISICTLFIVSSAFIYFYNPEEDKQNNAFINFKTLILSINPKKTIL